MSETREWQPIETAPEEGAILVWDGENVSVAEMSSTGTTRVWSGGKFRAGRIFNALVEGEVVWTGDGDTGGLATVDFPTHWQPLPPPPALKET